MFLAASPTRVPQAAPTARLLADVGGTNARFAWQAGPSAEITDIVTLPAADHATLGDAMAAYLAQTGRAAPADCSVAIANPVTGDALRMTNHHWSFSVEATRQRVGFERLLVLNDFTALAMALPALRTDELRQVGGGAVVPGTAIGLIGPGTGLGVSGLIPDGRGRWLPLQGEGGHITLAGRTPRECAVIERIDARYGHVSAERAVSGQGLVDIHLALQALDEPAREPQPLDAAEISAGALADPRAGGDARCREAVELFCAFLGTAAGNLALTVGARGGVYIGGGIVPRLGSLFERSAFRERFESKGRFKAYLGAMPVFVIEARRSPAFLGAAGALDDLGA